MPSIKKRNICLSPELGTFMGMGKSSVLRTWKKQKKEYLEERFAYEQSLKIYRDNKNSFKTAVDMGNEKGVEKGRAEGEHSHAMETAGKMLAKGLGKALIAEIS